MTPELERVLARGRDMHPTFPDDVQLALGTFGVLNPKYTESINLPDLGDKRGILQYVGLNDAMIDWALEKYHADFPSDPEELAVKFNEMNGDIPTEGYRFPLLDRFNTILVDRGVQEIEELDISYGESSYQHKIESFT
ncbi:hypothetical protein PG997_010770 [Apiospora hydei]|uniref:Uncharacterized protein n=1 Tax=Apiospora hydei TaxID=1337664 RepID=A0ABR1VI54_9PEZI